MAKKTYRRFIRIGNDLIASPEFKLSKDADSWYEQMKRKKQFVSSGLVAPAKKNEGLKFIDYARGWIKRRIENYPKATWQSDEQRLRDYVLPYFSESIIDQITSRDIRALLVKLTSEENLSIGTRTRVKSLLSKMFSDAFNEEIIPTNPVYGIKFDEKRVGRAKPIHIESKDECIRFIATAREMGPLYLTAASLTIMTGLRKSEILALTWPDIDFRTKVMRVSKRVEQASMTIKLGTKAGELETRLVPFSDQLAVILKDWRKICKTEHLFSLEAEDRFMSPRTFYDLITRIGQKAEIKITVHGLRHTYGRNFVLNSGNMKALQAILGHSSSTTTDIYSNLSGENIKGFGEYGSIEFVKKETKKGS